MSRHQWSNRTPESHKTNTAFDEVMFCASNNLASHVGEGEVVTASIIRSLFCGLIFVSLISPGFAETTPEFKKISISTDLSASLIVNEDEISGDLNPILAVSEQQVVIEEAQTPAQTEEPETVELNASEDTPVSEEVAEVLVTATVEKAEKAEDKENAENLAQTAQVESESIQEPGPDPLGKTSQDEQIGDQKADPAVIEGVIRGNIERDIEQAIQSWVLAWSDQDVDRYLGHYSENFTPGNKELDRSQWVEQRTERISKPSQIKLSLAEIQFTGMHDQVMQVIFRQKYVSDNYNDEIIKSLDFINQDGSWKIIGEKTVKVLN